MSAMRKITTTFGGFKVLKVTDYSVGVNNLPKSDVLQFTLTDDCSVIIRPSGTEPKLKFYLFANGENKQIAKEKIEKLHCLIDNMIEQTK